MLKHAQVYQKAQLQPAAPTKMAKSSEVVNYIFHPPPILKSLQGRIISKSRTNRELYYYIWYCNMQSSYFLSYQYLK